MFSVVLLGSCNKYSDKVAGTYTGQISINDSIISNNASILISRQLINYLLFILRYKI